MKRKAATRIGQEAPEDEERVDGVEWARTHFPRMIQEALDRQAEDYRQELEAGPDVERAEELRAWFALREARKRFKKAERKREEQARRTGAITDQALVDLSRPRFMN